MDKFKVGDVLICNSEAASKGLQFLEEDIRLVRVEEITAVAYYVLNLNNNVMYSFNKDFTNSACHFYSEWTRVNEFNRTLKDILD